MFGSTFTGGGSGGGGGPAIQLFYPNGQNATIAAGTVNYLNPYTVGLFVAAGRSMLLARPCIISGLTFNTNSAQPGSGSLVVDIATGGGVLTGITVTFPAGSAAATRQDLVNTFTVTAADIAAGIAITVKIKNNAAALSAAIGGCAFTITYT